GRGSRRAETFTEKMTQLRLIVGRPEAFTKKSAFLDRIWQAEGPLSRRYSIRVTEILQGAGIFG
ncbi:MAG: hypothetical protein R3338_13035, partial [Thermoanaerobaculia bacterium]|nr:hypothetical protein [Thermoanaerobaculia bacterium]